MSTITSPAVVLAPASTAAFEAAQLNADARRTRLALVVLCLALLMNGGTAILIAGNREAASWAWEYALASSAMTLGIFCAYCYGAGDRSLFHWGVVALTAGFVELIADAWLVQGTNTLNYRPWGQSGQPMIWASPAYMPFAWTGVLLQIITIGDALRRHMRPWMATLLTGLLGGINIPLYEAWAFKANWWAYQHTPMIARNAPYFIALGEFLLCLPLGWFARKTADAPLWRCVAYGALIGAGIFVSYWVSYQLMGRCGGLVLGLDFAHGCMPAAP